MHGRERLNRANEAVIHDFGRPVGTITRQINLRLGHADRQRCTDAVVAQAATRKEPSGARTKALSPFARCTYGLRVCARVHLFDSGGLEERDHIGDPFALGAL